MKRKTDTIICAKISSDEPESLESFREKLAELLTLLNLDDREKEEEE